MILVLEQLDQEQLAGMVKMINAKGDRAVIVICQLRNTYLKAIALNETLCDRKFNSIN